MNKREQYKRLIKFLMSLAIVGILTAVYASVWYTSYVDSEAIEDPFFRRGNYVLIAQYALMLVLFYKVYDGFRVGYLRTFDVMYSQILSVVCVNVITYLQLCLIGRWRFMEYVKPMVQMTVFDVVLVIAWVTLTQWAYSKIYPPRKLLLVYGKYSPDNLIRKIGSRQDKYDIEETISDDSDIEEIKAKINQYRNVILTDISADLRNKLLKYCYENSIRCYCVPKISDIMIRSTETIHLFDTTLLMARNLGLTADQRFLKRLLDLVLSITAAIITAPLMLLIAICVKAYDKGPVFFTQDRLTKDGKVFKLIKFRSMRVRPEDEEYCLTKKGDPRITPIGNILRKLHLDELPQIYNILKGDMSFVGPRPECPKLAEEYCQMIPEFKYRLKVKAGLTGFAQVYGKYNTTPYDKLKLDLTYIENYSFLLDLKLVMLTVKILFQKENTEGIEDWQTNAATKDNLEKIGKK